MPSVPDPETADALREERISLRKRAMDMLARREHARAELAQKLGQRFPDSEAVLIAEVLDQLEADNLLSDERFVESCLRSRMSRGYGPLYIEQYLRQRGVAALLIDRYLQSVAEEVWQALAGEVLEKKLAGKAVPQAGSRAWQSLQRYLGGRGFTGEQIRQAFRY